VPLPLILDVGLTPVDAYKSFEVDDTMTIMDITPMTTIMGIIPPPRE